MGIGIVENGSGGKLTRGVVVVEFHVETLRFVNLPNRIELRIKGHCLSVFAYFARGAVVRAAVVQGVRIIAFRAHEIRREIPVEEAVVALL